VAGREKITGMANVARDNELVLHPATVNGAVPPSSRGEETAPPAAAAEHARPTNRRLVARNVFVVIVTQIISWGLALLVTVYLPGYAGEAGMGKMALAYSYVSVCGALLPLGTGMVMIREIARDNNRLVEIMRNAFALRVPLSLLMAAALMGIVSLAGYDAETRLLVLIGAIGMLILNVNDVLSGALQGLENLSRQSLSVLIDKFVGTGLTIVFILLGLPLWAIAGIAAITAVIALGVNATAFRSVWSLVRASKAPLLPRWHELRGFVLSGLPFLSLSVFMTIYSQADPIVLRFVANDAVVGWYSTALRLVGSTMFIPAAVQSAVMPTLARLYMSDRENFRRLAQHVLRLLGICAVPIAMLFVFSGDQIIQLLYRDKFEAAGPVLRLGGVHVLLNFITIGLGAMIYVADLQKQLVRISMGALLVSIPGCVLFSYLGQHYFGNGAAGAILSDSVRELFILVCFIRILPAGVLTRSVLTNFGKCLLAGGIASGVLVMIGTVWSGLGPVVPALAVYLVLIFVFKTVDRQYLSLLKDMMRRR
jgi:Membrane protein involved in the export of O-antigen and teichoic acid